MAPFLSITSLYRSGIDFAKFCRVDTSKPNFCHCIWISAHKRSCEAKICLFPLIFLINNPNKFSMGLQSGLWGDGV